MGPSVAAWATIIGARRSSRARPEAGPSTMIRSNVPRSTNRRRYPTSSTSLMPGTDVAITESAPELSRRSAMRPMLRPESQPASKRSGEIPSQDMFSPMEMMPSSSGAGRSFSAVEPFKISGNSCSWPPSSTKSVERPARAVSVPIAAVSTVLPTPPFPAMIRSGNGY